VREGKGCWAAVNDLYVKGIRQMNEPRGGQRRKKKGGKLGEKVE